MNPREDNQENEAKPDVSVDIPHGEKPASPAPTSAPPLPELEPLPQPPTDTNVPTPPPIPPASQYEFHEHEDRRWPVVLMYIILAFLVAAAIVFAGRWVYDKLTGSKAQPTPTTTEQTQGQGTAPSPPASSSPSSPEAGANQNVPVATSGQLPNNGPGDVIAIFVGTAAIVGGLHFIYSLRKKS